ncbi:hypothetical protein TNCV_4526971 [Trichonephila clavipes]|nr:hypothetical protein TNCV_4526971 [Trichonephila clavipes]
MVLKANDRRTSCPCHDEFRGPRSDYVRQVERDTRYREGSGNDGGEKGPNEERTGERWREKRGRIKERLQGRWIVILDHILFLMKCPMEDAQ